MIGVVTEETAALVSPGGIETVDFGDPVEAVNRVAKEIEAQDLADVIGLIRRHCLRSEFARRLETTLRPTFRKLARAIEREARTTTNRPPAPPHRID